MIECAKCQRNYGKFTNSAATNNEWWCENCASPALPRYLDDMEKVIGRNFSGRTKGIMIEKHRASRAKTERQIGWDGSTTREQRMRKV